MFNDQFPATRGAIRRLDEIRAGHAAKAAEATAGDQFSSSSVPAATGPAGGSGLEVQLLIDSVPVGTLHISVAVDLREGCAPAVRVSQNEVAR